MKAAAVGLGAVSVGGGLTALLAAGVADCDFALIVVFYLLGVVAPQPHRLLRKHDDNDGDD